MSDNTIAKRKRLSIILSVIFAIAMVVGLGIGLKLINPDPKDPDAIFIVFGMPIIYYWTVFWFLVEAAVVLIAYLKLWNVNES